MRDQMTKFFCLFIQRYYNNLGFNIDQNVSPNLKFKTAVVKRLPVKPGMTE